MTHTPLPLQSCSVLFFMVYSVELDGLTVCVLSPTVNNHEYWSLFVCAEGWKAVIDLLGNFNALCCYLLFSAVLGFRTLNEALIIPWGGIMMLCKQKWKTSKVYWHINKNILDCETVRVVLMFFCVIQHQRYDVTEPFFLTTSFNLDIKS